ncbi:CorA family divalent cation transporter [Thermosynechococcus vestitus]
MIFIPLTFIIAIYGMNVDPDASHWNMPELGWYWGYPARWVLMLTSRAVYFSFSGARAGSKVLPVCNP